MELIHNNPYRIAGILSNTKERELQKQKAKFKAYSKVGKEIKSDYDFEILNGVVRDKETIDKAFSNIEQNYDKVKCSLFWFLTTNSLDKTALNHLINGNVEKAHEIWEKVTYEKEISSKNYSSFNNIGTMKLLGNTATDIGQGIQIKIRLIESDSFKNFVQEVADVTFRIDSKKESEKFVDELLKHFRNQFSDLEQLKLFEQCNGKTKKYVAQKLIEPVHHLIETKIENSQNRLKEAPDDGIIIGKKLIVETKHEIQKLKSILGKSNIQYSLIADKLANQIFLCAIKYFNKNNVKNNVQVGKSAIEILNEGLPIAETGKLKKKFEDDLKFIGDWILEQPDSENAKAVSANISIVNEEIEKLYQYKGNNTNGVLTILTKIEKELKIIVKTIGETDAKFVLGLSSNVVQTTTNLLVEITNDIQNQFTNIGKKPNDPFGIRAPSYSSYSSYSGHSFDPDRYKKIAVMENLKKALDDCHRAFKQMKKMQKKSETKAYYDRTQIALTKLRKTAYTSLGETVPAEGCYIATMAYGDYGHPQVKTLRLFRDDYLDKSFCGRLFIKTYYRYSPLLVTVLKDKKNINHFIRTSLDILIKVIKK